MDARASAEPVPEMTRMSKHSYRKWLNRGRRLIPERLLESQRLLRHFRHNLGLQSFLYMKGDVFPVGRYVASKYRAIYPDLAALAPDKTVLDIGSSHGFYTLLAARLGARMATGLEGNPDCVARSRKIAAFVGFPNVQFVTGSFPQDCRGSFDITLAFAISHWLFLNWPQGSNWREVIGALAATTREHLLIEYVEPGDATFTKLGKRPAPQDYNLGLFTDAIQERFTGLRKLGENGLEEDLAPTRLIYLATK